MLSMQDIERLQRRLEEVERELGDQHETVRKLRKELEAITANHPELQRNPMKKKTETPAERLARNQRLIADARAAKRVGSGKGKVSSKKVQQKLKKERKR